MQWRRRRPGAKVRARQQWHLWFAWHPVSIPTTGKGAKTRRAWLEKVYRKANDPHYDWNGDFNWNYHYKSAK